ncbi:MAG: glycoside hydrolase family 3 N-terminal domain-containing protein [Vicingaceae bacterium]
MKRILLFSVVVLSVLSFQPPKDKTKAAFLTAPTPWADSLIKVMTLDEKIGQLFNVAAYSNRDEKHTQEILEQIRNYHIGGLTFFKGTPYKQAELTNLFQDSSRIPLMIAMDGEWGLSMRLDSTIRYPWQMTLGAVQDNDLIFDMGKQIAEQFRRLGVHVNFAPVVDVNNNPNNPVINARSFGEDKRNVAAKGIAYMQGLQSGRVLACAKHFPGHGDTDTDSHISLPVVNHTKERIDSLELYPFKQLIAAGVSSMMTAHMHLPVYTPKPNQASSLSAAVVDTLLKQQLNYGGLVFTDGLNMGGVASYQRSEEVDLQAIQAGNDILLLSKDVPKAVEAIKKAIENNQLSEQQIHESAYKVLKAKEWLRIHKQSKVDLKHLHEDLNHTDYTFLKRKLVEKSLTLIRNEEQIVPIKNIKDKRIVSLALGEEGVSYRAFQKTLNLYAKVDTMHYTSLPVSKQKALMDTLLTYDQVIVSVHKSNDHPWVKFEIDNEFKNFINILRLKKKIILDVFANAYSLQDFLGADFAQGLILSYQNSKAAQELSAQLIFGGVQAEGKLPVSVSTMMKAGDGLLSELPIRLKYSMPQDVGIDWIEMAAVDSIVMEGIQEKAYPGAQVYVAKDGKVIYHKTFGKHTYEGSRRVESTDLYDLASVTKIASSLLAIMHLDSENKLSLDDKLGKHLKMTRGTDYANLVIRDILAHQAGLAAWIPFYVKTMHHGMPQFGIYSKDSSKNFSIRVAEDLYMANSYRDSIFHRILYRAKLDKKKEYKYSDIGYYLLKEAIEEITAQPINEYVQTHFYENLGMHRTTFLPLHAFNKTAIIPTEFDQFFRKQLVHGDVHDPGAAMLGGVGGHAGLFSNANDLGKLMQMYLQKGSYAGSEYLDQAVVEEYTDCQFCNDSIPQNAEENRRGAGFDKPQFHGEPGPTCECISFESFGHSGFTGTYAWADPEEDLVYIFLSNRVYPDASNSKLVKLNIRTRIQEKIYEAVANAKFRAAKASLTEDRR